MEQADLQPPIWPIQPTDFAVDGTLRMSPDAITAQVGERVTFSFEGKPLDLICTAETPDETVFVR